MGKAAFYGWLARHGRDLFCDQDCAEMHCLDNGRTSVPPSLLAIALLLQAHDRVSDDACRARGCACLRFVFVGTLPVTLRRIASAAGELIAQLRALRGRLAPPFG